MASDLRGQIRTWPNAFTALRLCAIPYFVYLLFTLDRPLVAAWLLGFLGATDWVDGFLARKLDQRSQFGAVFDPTVDRLMFAVAVPSIVIEGAVPWWLAGLALLREVLVAALAAWVWLKSREVVKVSKAGKTGAFFLMFAFPMFLGGSTEAFYADQLVLGAWILSVPGLLFGFYSVLFDYVKTYLVKST